MNGEYQLNRDIQLENEEIPVAKDPRPLWKRTQRELDELPELAFGRTLLPSEPLTIDQATGSIETKDEAWARNQRLEDSWEELQEICVMVAAREHRGVGPVTCGNCSGYNFDPHIDTRTLSCSNPHCHMVYTFDEYREELNR